MFVPPSGSVAVPTAGSVVAPPTSSLRAQPPTASILSQRPAGGVAGSVVSPAVPGSTQRSVIPAMQGSIRDAYASLLQVATQAAEDEEAERAASPKPGSPRVNKWVAAPCRATRIETGAEQQVFTADEGWQRWLKCSAETDAGQERRVESVEYWAKRKKNPSPEKNLGAFLPNNRSSAAKSPRDGSFMQSHDPNKSVISALSAAISVDALEADLARAIADIHLPCNKVSLIETGGGGCDGGVPRPPVRDFYSVVQDVKPHSYVPQHPPSAKPKHVPPPVVGRPMSWPSDG